MRTKAPFVIPPDGAARAWHKSEGCQEHGARVTGQRQLPDSREISKKNGLRSVSTISKESEASTAQRLFELTTLYEISRLLQASTNLHQVTFDVLTAVIGLTGARWGVIWLSGNENGSMVPVQACGYEISTSSPTDLPGEWTRSLSDRPRPFLLNNGSGNTFDLPGHDGVQMPLWLADHNPELILPLSAGGKLSGLITLGPNFLDRTYEPFLLNLLGSVGYLVALTLGRKTELPQKREGSCSDSVEAHRQRFPVLEDIVGQSPAILDLFKHLNTVAHASCTVLLEGETGTGKQLTAEVLHNMGSRRDGPFIEVDCGSVPETLIESELFGHKKGAFTGADHDRKGVFELADGGTLFLDEVSNLPPSAQGRLLHVLQERRFRPLGGAANIEVDVRVIAASNRDLRRAVQEGSFREDLFYRLYVYPIHIPSLRERREDIPVLASFFLRNCAEENGIDVPGMTDGFLQRLSLHDFPGNIRELRHIMERLLLQSEGKQTINSRALDEVLPLQNDLHGHPEEKGDNRGVRYDFSTPTGLSRPNAFRPGYSRGAWVIEVLKDHRYNIRAAAETLSTMAERDHCDIPPLTDRSSLTYYLQGECFRLFLKENGDIDRVGNSLAPDDDELRRIAVLRVQKYMDAARETVRRCGSISEAREAMLHKFSKLPGIYRNILLKLADFLWQAG